MKKIDTQFCDCEECSSGKYNQKDYFVTQEEMQNRKLKNGLSGVLRVKNEEFLDLAIKTTVDALDELIIVVQKVDHDPYNSFEVAKKFEALYPKKIKVYLYEPNVDSPTRYETNNNLVNKDEIIKRKLSVHGAANYYNFSFSKVNYKYSMKIDADQYYFTDKLDFIRNVYKNNVWKIVKYYLNNIFHIKNIIKLHKKLKKGKKRFSKFYGIELYNVNKKIVSITKTTPTEVTTSSSVEVAILPPFNGGADHIISPTKFQLYELSNTELYELFLYRSRNNYITCGTLFFHMHSIKENYLQRISLVGFDFNKTINKHKENILDIDSCIEQTSNDLLKSFENCEKSDKHYPYTNKIKEVAKFWDYEKNYRIKYWNKLFNELKHRIDLS